MEDRKAIRQSIFNRAYLGLKAQGFKVSATAGGKCMYRGPGGLKCAAGHLIPDDRYAFAMERRCASDVGTVYGFDIFGEGVTKEDENFLDNLQEAHDYPINEGHDPGEECPTIEPHLRELARRYNLEVPE